MGNYYAMIKTAGDSEVQSLELNTYEDAKHFFNECLPWIDKGFIKYVEIWDYLDDEPVFDSADFIPYM